MQLPLFQSAVKELMLLQTKWKSILDPLLATVSTQSSILSSIQLVSGTNVINHLLGRKLTGWVVVRRNGLARIYDNQDLNQHTDLTLILVSDAVITVTLEVY